jgi:electron transfer flavoprotein alpha/beta subunit
MAPAAPAPLVVLLRRLQARPGTPGDESEVLGRCEGGALSAALDVGTRLEAPVVAIAVGPARREDRVLAMALRAGCARAVRIDDSDLGDVDYLGLAQVLAKAVAHVGARLVVCGDRSGDEGAGAVGPALAELLEWSHLTAVVRATVEGDGLVVVRHGDGVVQRLRLQPPAVLCVVAPPVAARAAEPHAVYNDDEQTPEPAKRKRARTPVPTIDEIDLADLGLDARAIAPRRTSSGKLRQVRARGAPTLASSATDLIARLRGDRLL